MDEAFLVLLGIAFGLLLLAAPFLALIAFLRTRSINALTQRVEALERELALARRRETHAAKQAESVEPVPAPAPVPAVIATVEPLVVAAPPPPLPPPPPPPLPQPAAPLEAPPPRESVVSPAPAPAPVKLPSFDWERWIGVRGAAVLGGLFLALAGLLFFQYSIQRGWITPALRCSLGAVVGVAAIAGASWLRRREYRTTADALTGAGATILYGAAWAARVLYELIPPPLAFGAMIAITVLCGWLAVRHASQTIAVFGLLGGFATPLLLASSEDRSLGLFGYLLLLNVGIVAVGRKRQWPAIALLATLATSLLFGLWLRARFDESHFVLALAFCGSTALLFAFNGNSAPENGRRRWLSSQTIGIVTPLLFALYFASRAQLELRLVPLAIFAGVLSLAALWTASRQRAPHLLIGVAVGDALMLAIWILSSDVSAEGAWQAAVASVVLAGIVHVGLELAARRRDEQLEEWSYAASAAVLAMLVALAPGALKAPDAPLWPWLAGALALAVLGVRQATIGTAPVIAIAGYVGAAFVAVTWLEQRSGGEFPALSNWTELCVFAGIASFELLLAFVPRGDTARKWALRGVCVASVLLLLERAWWVGGPDWSPAFVAGETAALIACGAIAAAALSSGLAYTLIAAAGCIAQARIGLVPGATGERAALATIAGTWVIISAWPWLARKRLGASRLAWCAGAIACALWFAPVASLISEIADDAPDSTALIAGAVLAALIALLLRAHARERDQADRPSALSVGFVWFASVALGFASFAISVEVGHGIDLVGIALWTAGLAVLARWLDRTPLRAVALAGCAFVFLRAPVEVLLTITTPFGEHYELRSGYAIAHWLSYSIGVAAIALFVAAAQMRRSVKSVAWLAQTASTVALFAILVTFLWVNVEVVNLFSSGPTYDFSLVHKPARDLTMSVAWAAFGLTLLLLAVKLDKISLRWTSLAFFLAAIAKAFLYDLATLQGLYRVGSLVGLAFALLVVSVLYQRFVFRSRASVAPASE